MSSTEDKITVNRTFLVFVKLFCVFVGLAMTWVTWRASVDTNVLDGFRRVAQDPWGLATLFDAYFAFLFFYLWLLTKETRLIPRILWFVFLMGFGNFAIALFVGLYLRNTFKNKTTP